MKQQNPADTNEQLNVIINNEHINIKTIFSFRDQLKTNIFRIRF